MHGLSVRLGQRSVAAGPDDVHIARVVREREGLPSVYPYLLGREVLMAHADRTGRCLRGCGARGGEEGTNQDQRHGNEDPWKRHGQSPW